MKTKDLIAALQIADPSGEIECVVGCSDIHFVSKEPMYYDGCPSILIKDQTVKKGYYNIIGYKSSAKGYKVVLHTMDAEDILIDNPEAIVELDDYANGRKGKWVEEKRIEYRALQKEIDDEIKNKP